MVRGQTRVDQVPVCRATAQIPDNSAGGPHEVLAVGGPASGACRRSPGRGCSMAIAARPGRDADRPADAEEEAPILAPTQEPGQVGQLPRVETGVVRIEQFLRQCMRFERAGDLGNLGWGIAGDTPWLHASPTLIGHHHARAVAHSAPARGCIVSYLAGFALDCRCRKVG